jgi:hypothetical protein
MVISTEHWDRRRYAQQGDRPVDDQRLGK